jgi:rhodanese-related sulfurtransferase
MPIDSIRSRISELDKTKPVYVTCRVGLRGYIAARILSQNGFDVYNSIFGDQNVLETDAGINPETQLPEG